ncbi:MAG: hypothetical protein FD189_2600 [Elusimicrobia bacterium]|nr:MAG: hypothetical protein FD189_2600 [Elusimicrobiota bacterium]
MKPRKRPVQARPGQGGGGHPQGAPGEGSYSTAFLRARKGIQVEAGGGYAWDGNNQRIFRYRDASPGRTGRLLGTLSYAATCARAPACTNPRKNRRSSPGGAVYGPVAPPPPPPPSRTALSPCHGTPADLSKQVAKISSLTAMEPYRPIFIGLPQALTGAVGLRPGHALR